MSSSDSEDSDSILPNLQKTRELWNQKSEGDSVDHLVPKTSSPPKSVNSPQLDVEGNDNAESVTEGAIRFEDKVDDGFEMPDVKSMKSQWERAGPVPVPKKYTPVTAERKPVSEPPPNLVPVNREQEEQKEEYEVKLGALREKFELEAKAATARVVWDDNPRENVSKAAVDEKKNMKKKHVSSAKSKTRSPTSSSKTTSDKRQTSMSSDASSQAADIVRYDDPPTEEVKFEIEVNSLRKRFEQAAVDSSNPMPKSRASIQRKASDPPTERRRRASESDNVEIVRSADQSNDEMVGQETVRDRLARYKALTGESNKFTSKKYRVKKRQTADIVVENKTEEENSPDQEQGIVRSPPAGTKEVPDFEASIELEQAIQVFESNSSPSRSGRSSRSSSTSPRRRSPRSRSTPSPINRGSLSTSSSKSASPVRSPSRSSTSSRSSSRGSPSPTARKTKKKFGDPDVVVLEHTEVNYYYEDGTRLSTKTKSSRNSDNTSEGMSNEEVIKPPPAGTKEEADYVPSVNLRSVRDMFEHPKEEDAPPRGRETQPKKTVVIEKTEEAPSSPDKSPERNPEVIRSTTAGTREEPEFAASIDLKSARSMFESPHRVENYVPKNKIKEREEEARRQRAAAAAASPRSSESSESSGFEVIKSTEAGSKENPGYQLDLKATKKLFEGGRAPDPIQRETSTSRPKHHEEIKGDIIRPEPAGTKEIPEFEKSTDLKSAKMKFEGVSQEHDEEDTKRKDPIDIQEEARMVVQKEQEVKQEVHGRLNSHSDTERDSVVEKSSRNATKISAIRITVSSVKKQQPEPTAAAVVPVRVAIPEDLSAKKEDADVAQEYGSYTNVIDYNKEVQQPASTSDSESEKDEPQTNGANEVPVVDDDGLKQNGYVEEKSDSPVDVNYVDEPASTGKGIGNADDSLSPPMQQEITGKNNEANSNDIFGNIIEKEIVGQDSDKNDLFGLGNIASPPQLLPEISQDSSFGSSLDPLVVAPTPPPRGNKKDKVDPDKNVGDCSSSSDDDDFDKPHFKYPYDEDNASKVTTDNTNSYTNNSNNGLDIFEFGNDTPSIPSKAASAQDFTANLLDGFDSLATSNSSSSNQPLANFDVDPFQTAAPQSTVADPFDIFAKPTVQESAPATEKDPFDLFA